MGRPAPGGFADLLRGLPGMQAVMQTIRNLARLDVPVLIEGEAGTGIELVAHEIHILSPRRHRPFVTVPCSGAGEPVLGSVPGGPERQAVADDTDEFLRFFESADGGTVFFEEIWDVPRGVQLQLARMLKTHEIARVGPVPSRRVNVRLICATRYNLVQETAEGRFCADLLYKIRVAQVRLLPLRERRVDIPPLASFYLRESRLMPDRAVPSLSDEAMRILLAYFWPGNMNELQSAIEYAALRCTSGRIAAVDLPLEIRTESPGSPAAGSGETEKDRLDAALGAAKGNRTLAARLLGISRATLYRRLRDLGMGSEDGGVSQARHP